MRTSTPARLEPGGDEAGDLELAGASRHEVGVDGVDRDELGDELAQRQGSGHAAIVAACVQWRRARLASELPSPPRSSAMAAGEPCVGGQRQVWLPRPATMPSSTSEIAESAEWRGSTRARRRCARTTSAASRARGRASWARSDAGARRRPPRTQRAPHAGAPGWCAPCARRRSQACPRRAPRRRCTTRAPRVRAGPAGRQRRCRPCDRLEAETGDVGHDRQPARSQRASGHERGRRRAGAARSRTTAGRSAPAEADAPRSSGCSSVMAHDLALHRGLVDAVGGVGIPVAGQLSSTRRSSGRAA